MSRSNLRIITIAASTALAFAISLGASGCSAAPPPTPPNSADPPATSSAASAPSLTFAEGDALSLDADISWADGFAADDGWQEIAEAAAPGRWSYVNQDQTCTAAFRSGPLGDAGDMDDHEATDAVIAAQLGEDPSGLGSLLNDGYFFLDDRGNPGLENRQLSYSVNDSGFFVAARAFVAVNYSVHVVVTCEGADLAAVSAEVLSKNWIVIDKP